MGRMGRMEGGREVYRRGRGGTQRKRARTPVRPCVGSRHVGGTPDSGLGLDVACASLRMSSGAACRGRPPCPRCPLFPPPLAPPGPPLSRVAPPLPIRRLARPGRAPVPGAPKPQARRLGHVPAPDPRVAQASRLGLRLAAAAAGRPGGRARGHGRTPTNTDRHGRALRARRAEVGVRSPEST